MDGWLETLVDQTLVCWELSSTPLFRQAGIAQGDGDDVVV